jgi:hypothetical protein
MYTGQGRLMVACVVAVVSSWDFILVSVESRDKAMGRHQEKINYA